MIDLQGYQSFWSWQTKYVRTNLFWLQIGISFSERKFFAINLVESNALSFYGFQNVLSRSKFFEPSQKFDCI